MKLRTQRMETGFALIEALVSLVVVAVGVLGIAKLNSVLLQGTGLSKARAEAIQIAQDRVERSRNYELNTGAPATSPCDVVGAFAESSESVTGVNAAYTVSTTFPDTGTGWRSINVCVTWDGGSCGAVGNRVVLRSVLTCNGMGTSAHVGPDGASGMTGGFIKTPTGRGQIGGTNATAGSGAANTINVNGSPVNDGTRTYTAADHTLQLLDANGTALLSVKKLECETAAPAFSTITGTVFVEAKNGSPIAAASDLFVLSSDASYCAKLTGSYSSYYGVMPTGATGNSIKYFFSPYQCYIGAYWWGNIGVVRIDNANANNRVLVGSPVNSTTTSIFSKHPQLSTTRAYRGYRDLGGGEYETKGIGEQDTAHATCVGTKAYVPQHLEKHIFLAAVLSGQDTASSVETTFNGTSPTGSLGASSGNPTATLSGGVNTVTANNNPGKYYCMSNDDGISCPDLVSNPNPPTTLLHGTITRYGGAALTSIDDANSINSCSTQSLTANGSTSYTYSCQIDWTGFTAASWNGAIPFVASGAATLCASGATATIVPSGNNVAYTVNASNAASNANSINFTDIPNAVTDITLNFDVKATTCGALGQPNLSAWSFANNGSNSSSATTTWADLSSSGATAYKIRICSVNGQNTSCDPSGASATTQTTLSFTTTGGSMCVQVTATDGTVEGTASTKCVKKSGQTYSNF